MRKLEVHASPLTDGTFSPFGQVIAVPSSLDTGHSIGTGLYWPRHIPSPEGELHISLIRYHRRPFEIVRMERHPRSGQTFLPLGHQPFILLVASGNPEDAEDEPDISSLAAFVASGDVGVRLAPGTWHVSPFPLGEACAFAELSAPGTVQHGTHWYPLAQPIRFTLSLGSS